MVPLRLGVVAAQGEMPVRREEGRERAWQGLPPWPALGLGAQRGWLHPQKDSACLWQNVLVPGWPVRLLWRTVEAQEVDRGSRQSRTSLGAWTFSEGGGQVHAQPTKAHISKGGALSVWAKKRNLP